MSGFPLRTKLLIVLAVLFGFAPITFYAFYTWDTAKNRGFEFGYFGAFNRVRHALAAIPGVTITRAWANEDIGLEEFGFDITADGGPAVELFFSESDPTRGLSGKQLSDALTATIQQELQSKIP
jgi:hypothetical protein